MVKPTATVRILAFVLAAYAGSSSANDWGVDIGAGADYLKTENSRAGADSDARPSLFVGIHKFTGDGWRVGTSMEWLVQEVSDWSGSSNVIMWRLADIDYQLSHDLALNLHGGIARYYREQPSYGYGYGAGIKYRLTNDLFVSADITSASTDISTGVPRDSNKSAKDDLLWASLRFNFTY